MTPCILMNSLLARPNLQNFGAAHVPASGKRPRSEQKMLYHLVVYIAKDSGVFLAFNGDCYEADDLSRLLSRGSNKTAKSIAILKHLVTQLVEHPLNNTHFRAIQMLNDQVVTEHFFLKKPKPIGPAMTVARRKKAIENK